MDEMSQQRNFVSVCLFICLSVCLFVCLSDYIAFILKKIREGKKRKEGAIQKREKRAEGRRKEWERVEGFKLIVERKDWMNR